MVHTKSFYILSPGKEKFRGLGSLFFQAVAYSEKRRREDSVRLSVGRHIGPINSTEGERRTDGRTGLYDDDEAKLLDIRAVTVFMYRYWARSRRFLSHKRKL